MKRLSVNLASEPFVNRAVPLAAVSAALGAALLLTVFNLGSFVVLGREYRAQREELKGQETRLKDLGKDMAEKEKTLQSGAVASFAEEATYVSGLLQDKRFSWITFLHDLESVKAFGVQLQNVSPRITKDGLVQVNLRGMANPRSEMLKFEMNLFASPRFKEVQITNEQRDPGSPLTNFSITCVYVPEVRHAS